MPEIGQQLDIGTDTLLRLREFTLTTYHNLPNTILVTSLLLGAIQGNLAMVWVGVGLVLNSLTVTTIQEILTTIFEPGWAQLSQPASSICSIIPDIEPDAPKFVTVAPSHWFASTTYFVVFILYNAINVAGRPIAKGADPKRVDVRMAFSMSVILLSVFFFMILLLRGLTGCETWLGSILGVLVGSGVAIGYWHLLDVCHSGVPPDILNVIAATAPVKNEDQTPIICTA